MREITRWLRDDLFAEETYVGDEPHRAFRNPGGFRVVLAATGGGWIENPDGSVRVVSSNLDVRALEDYLP